MERGGILGESISELILFGKVSTSKYMYAHDIGLLWFWIDFLNLNQKNNTLQSTET